MISIEGNEKSPALWVGGSLAQFGQNPHGGNIWRVVWSESRNYMFGARWNDNTIGYRWIPLYTGKKCYILERWLSPYQYTKCTAERWDILHRDPDTGINQLGPYPAKGEYFGPCWEFDGYPTFGAVEAIIGILTRCDEIPEWEKNLMMIKARETEKVMKIEAAKEIIMDALPLRVTDGLLSHKAMKRAEDIPERFSAQDIQKLKGLPVGQNKAFTSGAERI